MHRHRSRLFKTQGISYAKPLTGLLAVNQLKSEVYDQGYGRPQDYDKKGKKKSKTNSKPGLLRDKDKKKRKRGKKYSGKNVDLTIQPLKTSKDKIKQPDLAEEDVIPHLTDCAMMNGRTGCGKTTLLANLLTRKEFFKGRFDRIFLVSPTGQSDDIQRDLGIDEDDVITNPDEAPEFIEQLMDSQKEQLKKNGADGTPLYCLIYDDCIGYQHLLRDPIVQMSFYACRHYNFTTFILTQSFTKVPRACRLQARSIFYFEGSNSEAELMCEEFAPLGMNKKAFKRLLSNATSDKFQFLHMQLRCEPATRFRRCLGDVIQLGQYDSEYLITQNDETGEQHKDCVDTKLQETPVKQRKHKHKYKANKNGDIHLRKQKRRKGL